MDELPQPAHRRTRWLLLCSLALIGLVQQCCYWPYWPERVATHFGIDGRPDGWMTRTAAACTLGGFQLLFPWLLFGIGSIVRRVPDRLTNLPHKKYWLHPSRREETFQRCRRLLDATAISTSLLLLGLSHLTYLANTRDGRLPVTETYLLLGSHVLFVLVTVVRELWRFRLPTGAALSPATTDPPSPT